MYKNIDKIPVQYEANTGVLILENKYVRLFLSHPIPLQREYFGALMVIFEMDCFGMGSMFAYDFVIHDVEHLDGK